MKLLSELLKFALNVIYIGAVATAVVGVAYYFATHSVALLAFVCAFLLGRCYYARRREKEKVLDIQPGVWYDLG